jgi:hypothetical protein
MFIEFELFSIEESCILDFVCGEFLLFCEFCGIGFGKNMFSKDFFLKRKEKRNIIYSKSFTYFIVVFNQSTKLKN